MNLQHKAEQTLALMQTQGFDAAMVEASDHALTEVSLAHDQAALMRATQRQKLSLLGLLDGRRASTELGDLRDEAVAQAVQQLLGAVRAAPQDAANAVSQGQQADILQGPQQADPAQLADAMAGLLAWRAAHTPSVTLEEAYAAHHLQRSHVLTSAGSSLRSQLGWYELMAMGTARVGEQSSSFAFADGSCHALDDGLPVAQRFGIGAMMRDLARQVHTQPLAVVLVRQGQAGGFEAGVAAADLGLQGGQPIHHLGLGPGFAACVDMLAAVVSAGQRQGRAAAKAGHRPCIAFRLLAYPAGGGCITGIRH